ncbi:MAG: hypothetical protein NC114_10850 [Ruminococcus flavefaciens]|nr:hypothetical protein [Ruminococcus flavefaciens]
MAKRTLAGIAEPVQLWEMANLRERQTGLPLYIYVSEKQGQHSPRIKVCLTGSQLSSGETLSISIEDELKVLAGSLRIKSKLLNQVFEWVKLNKETLLPFWNLNYDIQDLLDNLKKL